jgi:hypothetical protein
MTITWQDVGTRNGVELSQAEREAIAVERNIMKTKYDERIAAEKAATLQKATNKASAKAKLIAGEALTEAEADTIVI